MKWLLPCVSLILLAGLTRAQDNKPTKVEPKDGRCEIVFPGKPAEKGNDKSTQILLETQDGKAALMLQLNEMPNPVPIDNADEVKKRFEGGQGALVNALKGKILKSEDGKFGGYPCRDIDMEVPMLGIYRVKFILTGPKFYQVTAAGPKDYISGDEVKKFMESFKLKD